MDPHSARGENHVFGSVTLTGARKDHTVIRQVLIANAPRSTSTGCCNRLSRGTKDCNDAHSKGFINICWTVEAEVSHCRRVVHGIVRQLLHRLELTEDLARPTRYLSTSCSRCSACNQYCVFVSQRYNTAATTWLTTCVGGLRFATGSDTNEI